jgi:hypothetical protein
MRYRTHLSVDAVWFKITKSKCYAKTADIIHRLRVSRQGAASC